MLRIPNPGSDINIFVRIFRDIHAVLSDAPEFSLDDMTRALIERNNVSSMGAFGSEALRRSTRSDRSRDPLYNQSKMYAELYRALGWIQSTTGALRFRFSWLGEHAAKCDNPRPLVIECLLGIAYPNEVLGVQGDQSVRVFGAILATALAMDGTITRDEMIVGPLSIADDRDPTTFRAMIAKLKKCRSSPAVLASEISALGARRGITHETMTNYTRFPIAAMQWAGWAVKDSARSPLILTDEAHATLARVRALRDTRLSDYSALPDAAKPPFIRVSAHVMLARSGFDISSASEQLARDRQILSELGIPTTPDPFFSPFQQVARAAVIALLPGVDAAPHARVAEGSVDSRAQSETGRINASARISVALSAATIRRDLDTNRLEAELLGDLRSAGANLRVAAESFASRHALDNQSKYYPLVVNLLRLIGLDCRASRRGVNYDRADAMIIDPTDSIPIEIKSPGEELELSVKAIRQAVENKVVLLARGQFATTRSTTTLAIGFNAPNSRSDVRELIEDVHRAFGFNVGVIDLRGLATLALRAVGSGSHLALGGFTKVRGVLDVEHILAT